MTTDTDTRPGALLARRRWDRPENIERRVDALAEHITSALGKLPPLTRAQRVRLMDALKGTR